MLDTKLRKTRRFSWIAVFLSVFLPAVFIVSLYPKMSDIAREKVEEFKAMQEDMQEPEHWWMQSNYINYAVESSYYIYGKMLQEKTQQNVCFDVLEYYGWINDHYYFVDSADYYVEFGSGDDMVSKSKKRNTDLDYSGLLNEVTFDQTFQQLYEKEMVAYLILEYDSYGAISNVDAWSVYPFDSGETAYRMAQNSIEKYKRNALYFNEENFYDGTTDGLDKYQVVMAEHFTYDAMITYIFML